MKLRILSMICVISLVLGGCAGLYKKDYSAMVPGTDHGSVSVVQKPVTAAPAPTDTSVDGPSSEVGGSIKDPVEYVETSSSDTMSSHAGEDSDVGTEDKVEDIVPDGSDTEGTKPAPEENPDNAVPAPAAEITPEPTSAPENTSTPTPTSKPKNNEPRVSDTYKNAKVDASDPYGYHSTDSLASTYSDNFDVVAPTSNMSFAELVGDNGIYTLPQAFPEPETYKIIVDKYYQLIMVFSRDENGEYTVPVRYMLCSTGTSSSPTRSGSFHLKSYRVRFGLFANTDVYGQYWSQIDGRMYFHSILYSKRDASTYTGSFNNLGKRASHGCIRLTVPDARWIWYNAAPGTTVIVRDGSSSDTTTAAIKKMLTLDKMPDERPDSLTGDNIPYTDNWSIDEVPHDVEFIQGSQNNS